MGDKEQRAFQLSFNGFLKVDFQGSRVTSDGGLLLVRELDERLGLGKLIDEHLTDSRQGSNKKFPLADLVRQSVYSRLAGYEDLNDAVRVSADPTFRLLGSKKNWDRGGALTSRRQSFEAELLASEENLLGLMAVNRELVAQAEAQDQSERVVLDMDSTESPVHGQQEGSAYNGHFESTCYHPLLLFNQHGDCLAAKLRAGNVSSAEDWDELLLPEIERQQAEGKHVTLRADAAFAKPEIYEALEQRGVDYVIRMPANKNLELEIEDILFRPPGRPSAKPLVRYKSFRYQAASWSKPRRIVAKVELHPGELFARPGFLVTNKALPSRSVVCFYNKRGTAEQWIKEGKQATSWTRLSCHRFRANEVRLQLSVLAYTLGNLWRRLGLPSRIKSWSLTTLQHRLMKTGGRLVKHARYYWLLLAEGHLNRRLFGDMLRRLAALPVPGGELTHTAKLTASDGAVFDRFGHSISLSGQTIVVGAAFSDCAAGNNCGSAYVFEKPLGGWSGVLTETAKLTASDAAADDTFAWSVSISEDFIVMVAPADDCAAGGSCGAVYVFEEPLSGWSSALTESSKLTVEQRKLQRPTWRVRFELEEHRRRGDRQRQLRGRRFLRLCARIWAQSTARGRRRPRPSRESVSRRNRAGHAGRLGFF